MNQQSKTTFSISQASEMTGVSKNRIGGPLNIGRKPSP